MYDDYELLYLISEENEDAKDIFYEKYKPLVEIKAKKYYNQNGYNGYELNDLIQEGMIGLANAINDYSEDKNVKFSTFANICIDRQLLSFIRNTSRNKHLVLNSSISIDEENKTTGRTLLDILNDNSIDKDPEKSFVIYEEQEELKKELDNWPSN